MKQLLKISILFIIILALVLAIGLCAEQTIHRVDNENFQDDDNVHDDDNAQGDDNVQDDDNAQRDNNVQGDNNSQGAEDANYVIVETDASDVMSQYAISCKLQKEYSIVNADIPILLSFGLIEGCDANTDNYTQIVLKAENRDGQSIAIRQIEINNILKPEYVVESVWDENREWVIDFKYTHTEGINLPLSLFSGESGYISILLAECSSNDSAQSELGAGAYIILYYTHSETSITISTEAYDG